MARGGSPAARSTPTAAAPTRCSCRRTDRIVATTPDRYSHGHDESVLRSHRWRTAENSAGFLLPHLHPGERVLDVGCGPGTISADLARRVFPGSVTGIDVSDDVIE